VPRGGRTGVVLLNHRRQDCAADGFGEVIIDPRVEAALDVRTHGVGCQRDNDGVVIDVLLVLANAWGGFVAVHIGHQAVHEDEIPGLFLVAFDSFDPIFGDDALQA
jgi:hypothetical protein